MLRIEADLLCPNGAKLAKQGNRSVPGERTIKRKLCHEVIHWGKERNPSTN